MQAPAPVWVLFAVSAKAEGEARRVGMKEPWPKRAMAMVRRGPLLRTVVRGREVSVEVLWRRIRSLEDLAWGLDDLCNAVISQSVDLRGTQRFAGD